MRKLHEFFENDYEMFAGFFDYCDSVAFRWGFDCLSDLWNANPTIDFKPAKNS